MTEFVFYEKANGTFTYDVSTEGALGSTELSAEYIRDLLETLLDTERLDASAIQNLNFLSSIGITGSEFTITNSPLTTDGVITITVNAIDNSKITGLSIVATTNNYNDLTNLPIIPSALSELTNDVNFITAAALPTATSDLTNDSGFITIASIPTTLSSFTNDSGFITISSVPTQLSQLTNDTGFITNAAIPTVLSSFTNDVGFLTSVSWSIVTDKPTIPTATSQLTNDSGFITSSSIPTNTSELTNDSGFITSAAIPTNISTFTNDSGYLTSVSASDITTGTLDNARLTVDVTLAGNTFNGVSQLVQLDGSGRLPAIDGSQLTNLPSGNTDTKQILISSNDTTENYLENKLSTGNGVGLSVVNEGANELLNISVNHNTITGYVANEHIDHSTISIDTGAGLSGGGDITATRTINLDINSLTADATPDTANDYVVTYDASATGLKKVLLTNLGVGGGGGGTVNFATNIESLSANKTLSSSDDFVQILNPNGANREVILDTMTAGRIINNSDGTYSLAIKETSGGSVVLTLSYSTKNKSVFFVRNDDNSYFLQVESTYITIPDGSINVETLSATKTLGLLDPYTQLLNPDGANREVILNGKSTGKIINNSDGEFSLDIKGTSGGDTLISLNNSSSSLYKGVIYTQLSDGTYHFEVTATYIELDNKKVNSETLAADKVLVVEDNYYQILNPDGADRNVALAGRVRGEIVNNSDGTNAITISETDGGSVVATLSASSGYKYAEFIQLPDTSYLIKTGGSY